LKSFDKNLFIAEFAINNHKSNATGQSPYSLLYNKHAHIPQSIIAPIADDDIPRDATAYVGRWQTNLDTARAALALSEPRSTLKKY
jgi:hypothetical protein